MLELTLERKKLNPKDYIRRAALESDFDTLLKQDCIIYEAGSSEPTIVYLVAPEIPESIVDIVRHVRTEKAPRTQGLVTRSRIFGYRPRETIRKDFCSSASLSFEDPAKHEAICNFGIQLSKYYKKYCPSIFSFHQKQTAKISQDWIIENTPFTSGIINSNNLLKYHFDGGNIKDVYSNMVAFKKWCKGGYLALPEFNIGLEIADRSLLFFDGQEILHGVTPFFITRVGGYRYSLVYYTLDRMWECKPVDEEVARVRLKKTGREVKRYQRLIGEIPNEIRRR